MIMPRGECEMITSHLGRDATLSLLQLLEVDMRDIVDLLSLHSRHARPSRPAFISFMRKLGHLHATLDLYNQQRAGHRSPSLFTCVHTMKLSSATKPLLGVTPRQDECVVDGHQQRLPRVVIADMMECLELAHLLLEKLELADLLGQAQETVEVKVEALEAGEPSCRVREGGEG